MITTLTIDSIYPDNHILLRRDSNSKEVEIYFSFLGNNTKILLEDLKKAVDKL